MLHAIDTGDWSVEAARHRRKTGGYTIPRVVCIGAMSIYAACTATYIKIPADSGRLSHAQYARDLFDSSALTALSWVDTKDMLADGATHGALGRESLHTRVSG